MNSGWFKALLTVLFTAAVIAALGLSSCHEGSKYVMDSSSMSPTIKRGEIVLTKPFSSNRDTIQRYDLIVFRSPIDTQAKWIMRVVGLPGESIAISTNTLLINGVELPMDSMPTALRQKSWLTRQLQESSTPRQWNLTSEEVFVVGDNLDNVNDSRYWGPLKLSMITGVVLNVRARWGVKIVGP